MEIKLTKEVVDSWQILQDYDKITVVPFMYAYGDYPLDGWNDDIYSKNELDRAKWMDSIIKHKGLGMSFTYNPQNAPLEAVAQIVQTMSDTHANAKIQWANRNGIGGYDYQGLYFYDKNNRIVGCLDPQTAIENQDEEGLLYASDYAIENYNKKHTENQLSR